MKPSKTRNPSRWVGSLLVTLTCLYAAGCHTASDISPNPAVPGTNITISGTGFGATQGTSQVLYDGAVMGVVSWSNAQIVATVPSPKANGNYIVSIVVQGQAVTKPHTISNPITVVGSYAGSADVGGYGVLSVLFNGTAAETSGASVVSRFRSSDGRRCEWLDALDCTTHMSGSGFVVDTCATAPWVSVLVPEDQAPSFCDPWSPPQPEWVIAFGDLDTNPAVSGTVLSSNPYGRAVVISGATGLNGRTFTACDYSVGCP